MKEKLIQVCGKDRYNNWFVAGVVVNEDNIITKTAPILDHWKDKSIISAYRQFKNRFSFFNKGSYTFV